MQQQALKQNDGRNHQVYQEQRYKQARKSDMDSHKAVLEQWQYIRNVCSHSN
jgi:hypothetical protein